jgi:hypothetical protein
LEHTLALRSACTPRSVVSPDLEHGRRGIPHDLVLDRHRCEPSLASRSILRGRLSSCFQDADIRDRLVGAMVLVQDDLRHLHVGALDGQLRLLDVLCPPPPFARDLHALYHRIAARRGKKRAIGAVAHSIVVSAFHMLVRQQPYRELGADYFETHRRQHVVDRLTRRIERLGYRVNLEPQPVTP